MDDLTNKQRAHLLAEKAPDFCGCDQCRDLEDAIASALDDAERRGAAKALRAERDGALCYECGGEGGAWAADYHDPAIACRTCGRRELDRLLPRPGGDQ